MKEPINRLRMKDKDFQTSLYRVFDSKSFLIRLLTDSPHKDSSLRSNGIIIGIIVIVSLIIIG